MYIILYKPNYNIKLDIIISNKNCINIYKGIRLMVWHEIYHHVLNDYP